MNDENIIGKFVRNKHTGRGGWVQSIAAGGTCLIKTFNDLSSGIASEKIEDIEIQEPPSESK